MTGPAECDARLNPLGNRPIAERVADIALPGGVPLRPKGG